MSALRLPEGAELSVLRGRIIQVQDRIVRTDPGQSLRSQVRRGRNTAAAEALGRAEEILRRRVQAAEERLKHFEDKLCEGVTAFLLQNKLPEETSGGLRQSWLNQVWNEFKQFQPTRPLALYLHTALPSVDRLYLLDAILSRMNV